MKTSTPKILFILHTPPPTHGSSIVGQYIKESQIINQSFDCRYINLGTSLRIDEIGKKRFIKILRYFKIIWQVIIHMVSFQPNLCYVAISAKGQAFYKDAIVVTLVKMFGKNLVYHLHNKGVSTRQDKWLDNLLYHRVFKNSDIILLSKHLYPDIQKYVPEGRVYYCPNGIPDIADRSKMIGQIAESKSVNILFLSNLIETKGVFILLEACRILNEKQLPFHCTFVGSEGDVTASNFKAKADEFGLNKQVHYAGPKYDMEKRKTFAQTHIFAFPTYYHNECFALVLLEAMQHSLPVITTFEGGIPDIIGNGKTGFLVPQKNPVLLAEKLEILINSPELRKKMGKEGRAKYEQKFTLVIFEKRLESILNKILLRKD